MYADLELPLVAEMPAWEPADPGAEATQRAALRRADLTAAQAALGGLRQLAGEPGCVLLAGEGEGGLVSHASILVATATALAGARTMLLECDLESPRLAQAVGLELGPGLSEYLLWEAAAREILQPVALCGPATNGAVNNGGAGDLVCIVAGRAREDGRKLLLTDSLAPALGKLRRAYDVVVLAAGPVGGAGISALARQADALLICTPAPDGALTWQARAALAAMPKHPVGILSMASPESDQRS
jgi:Mrp family chromosome partitioning ATPase